MDAPLPAFYDLMIHSHPRNIVARDYSGAGERGGDDDEECE
jgi:hypothetical protein